MLIISSELDEIYALSDRIAVMYRGAIIGMVGPDTSRDDMGLLMAGVTMSDTKTKPAEKSSSSRRALR